MLVVGLTGSTGMGKSTVAEMFAEHGVAVCDADACVHQLYEGAAVPMIERAFPGTTDGKRVDRQKLLKALTATDGGFKVLEAIVHPLVREAEREFLKTEAAKKAKMAVLEIPLLFETGGDKIVDVTVVVSADPHNQRERVLERPDMSVEKFDQILSRQMPDIEKRSQADFVVDTNASIDQTREQVVKLIKSLQHTRGKAYQRHWA